jgi:hypothetical protein
MAGRGCIILIKLLGASGGGEIEDISLPVALHSPLEVLKQQLFQLVAIPPRDQVLILCDLTDPERNSDRLLQGFDSLSLRDCGIRNNSVLTLHALGMPAEQSQHLMVEALRGNQNQEISSGRNKQVLSTDIGPADADHR